MSKKYFITKLVSGGQTGVDRAALDVAIELGIPHGGWCPRGRIAEDGIIPAKYKLQEPANPKKCISKNALYAERTVLNIRDSDGTLIIISKAATGGTKLTIEKAKELNKPCFIYNFSENPNMQDIVKWIKANNIHILNVAGPRGSKEPDIYAKAYNLLKDLFS